MDIDEIAVFAFDRLFNRQSTQRLFHGNEKQLRQLCALSVNNFPNVEPIRSFALVGATTVDLNLAFDEVREFRYGHGFFDTIGYKEVARDTNRLRNAICGLIRSGVPVAPDFAVEAYDLLEEKDYLADGKKADVVVLCYLVDRSADELRDVTDWKHEYNEIRQYKVFDPAAAEQNAIRSSYLAALKEKNYAKAKFAALQLGGLCSPLASPEAWAKRLQAAEPKIIFNYHAMDSLPIHLTGNNLRTVVDDETGCGNSSDWRTRYAFATCIAAEFEQEKLVHFRAEIAMDTPFIEAVHEHLTYETLLAQAIRHATNGTPMTELTGYRDGYFENGDPFIPAAPYRVPSDFRGHDYLRLFWSLANPDDQSWDAQFVRATLKGKERALIESRIHDFFGPQNARPTLFRPRLSQPESSP